MTEKSEETARVFNSCYQLSLVDCKTNVCTVNLKTYIRCIKNAWPQYTSYITQPSKYWSCVSSGATYDGVGCQMRWYNNKKPTDITKTIFLKGATGNSQCFDSSFTESIPPPK